MTITQPLRTRTAALESNPTVRHQESGVLSFFDDALPLRTASSVDDAMEVFASSDRAVEEKSNRRRR